MRLIFPSITIPLLRCVYLCLGISVAAGMTPVLAGSWVLDEGAQQHIITYRYYDADRLFNLQGEERNKNGVFRKQSLEYYSEYGLTPAWTIGATLIASREEDKQDITRFDTFTRQNITSQRMLEVEGLSRIEPFARYQLYRDNDYALAVQPTVKLPSLYAGGLPPQAQPDEWEGEIALLAGANFSLLGRTHYADSRIGYRHRQGALGDQWIANATLGLSLDEDWTLMPQLETITSADTLDQNFATLSGSNNFDLMKGQISVLYRVADGMHVQAGYFVDIQGKNTGAGSGTLLSLWLSY